MPSLSSSRALSRCSRRDPLVVHADRDGLRALQEALGAVGELFEIHGMSLNLSDQRWCCRLATQVDWVEFYWLASGQMGELAEETRS